MKKTHSINSSANVAQTLLKFTPKCFHSHTYKSKHHMTYSKQYVQNYDQKDSYASDIFASFLLA